MKPSRRRAALFCAALLYCLSLPTAQAAVRVQVEGVDGELSDNIEARLSLRARSEADPKLDDTQVQRLHGRAQQEIEQALQPFGHYEPKVDASLDRDGANWIARYRVQAGPLTRVAALDAAFEGEGADFAALTDRLRWMPLKVGEPLRHADYEASKKRMADAALAQGFLDARWTLAELRVEPGTREARATLHLETGPRYFFGTVTLEQEGLKDSLIERYIQIGAGEAFDPQVLLDLQFRLSDLGYFEAVEIDPQRDAADAQRRIPIHIRTTPRARTRTDIGAGYGTDTGARASVGTDWRRLNRHGHTLNTDFRLSEIKNTLSALYRVPMGEKPDESLSFNAATETERLDAGDTLKYVIGASLNRAPGDWQRRLYVEFAHEESEFGDEFTTADLLTPGVSFTRSESDDPIFTRRGWYVFADVHGALNNVLSSTTFLQGRVIARGVHPLGRRLRLIGRAEVGYSEVEQFSELPASQRFFAGGDQSVRGYGYQSLGPEDDEGKVIGGRFLNVFSLEGEYRVWERWGAALFVDSGGVDDNPGPRLSTGVGAGIRYRAPIGSLQFDLAHPLDEGESGVRVHIGIRVGV